MDTFDDVDIDENYDNELEVKPLNKREGLLAKVNLEEVDTLDDVDIDDDVDTELEVVILKRILNQEIKIGLFPLV